MVFQIYDFPALLSYFLQEAKVDELEAQLKNSMADLKSAQKRIEQLHGALKDHEEFSGDEEDVQYTSSHIDSMDNLSSAGSSYSIEDDQSLEFSDEDEDVVEAAAPETLFPKSSRSLDRSKVSPARGKSEPRDREAEELEEMRKARERRLKKLDEEEAEIEASRKARQERLRDIDMEESHKEPVKARATETKREKKVSYDDDDDDDDDLEEFLLKQRERMKRMEDSDDNDDDKSDTIKSTRGASSRVSSEALASVRDVGKPDKDEQSHPAANGKANGVDSTSSSSLMKDEAQELSPRRKESVEGKNRRKRQRRRTIEQLSSPEHKINGVNM